MTDTNHEHALPVSAVRTMLDDANHLRQRSEALRRSAVDRCAHTEHSLDGGHAYCDGCDRHIGDPCSKCGHLKRSFIETCDECGAF